MNLHVRLLIIFLFCSGNIIASKISENLSPVIFVPGYGGSQLEARLNKESSAYSICYKKSDWFNLWLNVKLLMPGLIYCWRNNVKLNYDSKTRATYNPSGVEIRIPGWGDPEVVEWIDPKKNKNGAYFKDIANMLVDLGYERKKSIRGAPYDFRKAPNELKHWFGDLKQLVEDTYDRNKNTPVTFITHSMGSPMILVFLQQQTEEWKSKYVQRIISLAGAWAGSMKAVKVFAMGDDLDSYYLSSNILREQQIRNPSTAFLLPSPLFWAPSEIIAETPTRTYTMANLKQFLNDVDWQTGWEMRKDNIKYSLNVSPPQVEIHCLYGVGLQTVEKLIYKKDPIVRQKPKLVKGDGDGTVNARSLRACINWSEYQTQNITGIELPGIEHLDILRHETVLNYIKNILFHVDSNYSRVDLMRDLDDGNLADY